MIVDTHNDLLSELAFRKREANPFRRYWEDQLRTGGVGLQVCAVYASVDRLPEGALPDALQQVAACHRAIREGRGRIVLVRTPRDLVGLDPEQRLGLILALEGAEPLGRSVELAEIFWELGVRIVGLTWNNRNAFADGAGEPERGGLSRVGRQLVDQLIELGMILDLAHASQGTFADVLERASGAPVIVSHAACRAVLDHPRNLWDDQLRALAAAGGILGLMAHPLVVDPTRPTMDRYLDHLDHAVEIMGIKHVGIGADFIRQVALAGAASDSGQTLLPAGMSLSASLDSFEGPADYPRLVAAIEKRGYTGDDLQAILGGNFLRLFSESLPDPAASPDADAYSQDLSSNYVKS